MSPKFSQEKRKGKKISLFKGPAGGSLDAVWTWLHDFKKYIYIYTYIYIF